MKLAFAAAALSASAALAACAPNPPPPAAYASAEAPRACFRINDIRNHTVADERTLLLNANGRVFQLDMTSACLRSATSHDPLILRQPTGSGVVCRPIELDLAISRSGFPQRCIIRSISRLSSEQAAALTPRLRP